MFYFTCNHGLIYSRFQVFTNEYDFYPVKQAHSHTHIQTQTHMHTYQRQMQTSLTCDVTWTSSACLQGPEDPTWTGQSLVAVSSTPAVHRPPVARLHPKTSASNIIRQKVSSALYTDQHVKVMNITNNTRTKTATTPCLKKNVPLCHSL